MRFSSRVRRKICNDLLLFSPFQFLFFRPSLSFSLSLDISTRLLTFELYICVDWTVLYHGNSFH